MVGGGLEEDSVDGASEVSGGEVSVVLGDAEVVPGEEIDLTISLERA